MKLTLNKQYKKLNFEKTTNFCKLFAFVLFETGITDHTNILPASLISPMGTENNNYDYNIFDRVDVDTKDLLDVWANEME